MIAFARFALACALVGADGVAGIAAAPAQSVPAPPAAPAALTRDDYLADLGELTRRAAAQWSYADDKREHLGVDLEALRANAERALGPEPTLTEFAECLRTYVAGMKDGHAGVAVPGHSWAQSRVWPFTLADTAEGVLIDAVAEGTSDITRGDQLIAVDRQPIEQIVADTMRRTCASTDGARRSAALSGMRRTAAARVRCILQTPTGRMMELDFDTLPSAEDLQAPARPPAGSLHERLPGDIGYLRLGSLAPPDSDAWRASTPEQWPALLEPALATIRQAFTELTDTRALILDLRGNTGGTDLLGMEVARHLVPPGTAYFQLQSMLPDGSWSPPSAHLPPPEPAVPRYAGRVVVLIDERTFSAADNLCACLADALPAASFVGRPTGGGTGAPRAITLARSGAEVSFCTQRVYGPAGGLTEGRGVQPDVAVPLTRRDLVESRDADLEAALALLGDAER